jgi:5-methylcytosine-specific restriction protein A
MTKRRSITTALRLRVWAAHEGKCHICGLRIHAECGEKWDVEHVKPLWLGGEDTESNMAPAHKDCHAPKTAGEAKVRAKTNRVKAHDLGIKDETRRPIQSRGFPKRKERSPKPSLPPRALYR